LITFLRDQQLRYIFMDEAGTSAVEPVTVVVGIIANADEHVLRAEALVSEILGAVPQNLRSDFIFHATQVYGDKKYQDGEWSLTDRLNLLYAMMSVPRRIGMAITLAVHWRGKVDYTETIAKFSLTPAQADHFQSFYYCIALADRNIRKHADYREVATVVAEDIPEMRMHLANIPRMLRDYPVNLPQWGMRKTPSDEEAGYIKQSGDIRVTRIRNSVHFVEKSEDPLVQVADACAYGFRRFFADEKFGVNFVRAILGDEKFLKDFGEPCGADCFWFHN
jgi:hypothetical protein